MDEKIRTVENEVNQAVIGKEKLVREVLAVILAGGHILLDDIPGVGKTTLALALSRAMDLTFNRVQFTPDVVPSDITGFSVYNRKTQQFEYHEGAAMCSILLADEINRTSSKTQSALLEVMQENRITIDGKTHPVPQPFVVIATQNPIGTSGTQRLPESQLDRFMVQLSIGYPDERSEIRILKDRSESDPLDSVEKVLSAEELSERKEQVRKVFVDGKLYSYIISLVRATREHPLLRLGVSPRGSLALSSLCRASAWMEGRDFAAPEDVQRVFVDVCRHRVILNGRAQAEEKTTDMILDEILQETPEPKAVP